MDKKRSSKLMAPKMDCINVAGRLLGHRLTSQPEREVAKEKTKQIWEQHFPDEPFDLADSHKINPPEFSNGLVSKIAYGIEEAALRQKVFYYQVNIVFVLKLHKNLE